MVELPGQERGVGMDRKRFTLEQIRGILPDRDLILGGETDQGEER